MVSNKLPFMLLGAACITAAAGGGYIATRQNSIPAPASAMTAPASAPIRTPDQTGASSAARVQEAEAIGNDQAEKRSPAKSAFPKREAQRSAPSAAGSSTTSRAATNLAAPAAAKAASPAMTSAAANRHDQAPTLERSWSASAPQQPAQIPPPESVPAPPAAPAVRSEARPEARPEDRPAPEPARAPEPPQRTFEELVVSAASVLGLQTENRVSSDTARVEDRVEARVTRDVKVGDKVAIPAGSRAIGSVMFVERGGKFKERARLGIQFHTLVLADGTRLPMKTETVYRDGEAPGNSSAAKVGGGAIGGAILGAILGGAKGAAIGATAGAGGGAAVVASGDRAAATLPAGTPMTVRVLSPVTVVVEK